MTLTVNRIPICSRLRPLRRCGPDLTDRPTVSTLNALDGSITNNLAIVPSSNGKVDAYASGPGLTQLILDISSYFAP